MFKVALLGAINTGKTTFLHNLMEKPLPVSHIPTMFNVSVSYKDPFTEQEFTITDTAPSAKSEIWLSEYDGFIVFFDAERPKTYEMAMKIIKTIGDNAYPGTPVILVATKVSPSFNRDIISYTPYFEFGLETRRFPWDVFKTAAEAGKHWYILNSIQKTRDFHKGEYERALQEVKTHWEAIQRCETQLIRIDDMGV
jgi:GTPase SAR1 family protein